MEFKGKKILVLGMGETGLSMAKWLAQKGAQLAVADSRDSPPNLAALKNALPDVPVYAGTFRKELFTGVDLIAISPGVPIAEPLVQEALAQGVRVVGDIELFVQELHEHGTQNTEHETKIIAITGSNGKTTVTSMVGQMCKKTSLQTAVAGNISPAVLDVWMQSEADGKFPEVWALELSSYQLETTENLQADAATVLNLSEDHLDRYKGMEEYARAKARIFWGCKVQVLNRDDARSFSLSLANQKKVTFGLNLPPTENDFGLIEYKNELWLAQGKQRLIKVSELQVTGMHNVANALAALALCRAIGLPFSPLLQALREFEGLPHRVEKVAEIRGVTFFDDSKGTNVGATVAALQGMPCKVVLILGGDGKGQDFSPLKLAVEQHARTVVLIGRDAPLIEKTIKGSKIPILHADSMEQAVEKAFKSAHQSDVVLLSPACASFDMFRNYEHRAEVFRKAVSSLRFLVSSSNFSAQSAQPETRNEKPETH